MSRLRSMLLAAAFGCAAASPVLSPALAADATTASLIFYDTVGNETLDPAEPQSGSSFAQDVLLAIYDTLVWLDDAGNPTPGLAESWTASPDLSAFTFKLRPNIRLHDGSPLNAELVKRNVD